MLGICCSAIAQAMPVPRVVVVVVFDAARWDVWPVACGGQVPDERMPGLSAFCRESVVFTHAYTPGTFTWYAVPAIFTGLDPPHHRVTFRDLYLSPGFITFAEVFRAERYATYLISANRAMFVPETQFTQGFDTVDITPAVPGTDLQMIYGRSVGVNAIQYTALWHPWTIVYRSFRWMRKHCPRCLVYMHFAQPHAPYGAPWPVLARIGWPAPGDGVWQWWQTGPYGIVRLPLSTLAVLRVQHRAAVRLHADLLRAVRLSYRSGMVWAAEAFAHWWARVRTTDWGRRAVVIVTADHGEAMGEHGYWQHGTSVFEEEVRVPLIIRMPGLAPQMRSDLVSLTDIFATLLHLLRVRHLPIPPTSRVLPLEPRSRSRRKWVASFTRVAAMVRSHRYKLIYSFERKVAYLFDLRRDPGERRDLLPYMPAVGGRLFHTLIRHRMTPLPPDRWVPRGMQVSRALRDLVALGYTQAPRSAIHTGFDLAPLPLRRDRVRFRWSWWIDTNRRVRIRVVNTGDAGWPHRGSRKGQGAVQLHCEITGRLQARTDRWVGRLPRDLWPGQSHVWTVRVDSPNARVERCRLVQVGFASWTAREKGL